METQPSTEESKCEWSLKHIHTSVVDCCIKTEIEIFLPLCQCRFTVEKTVWMILYRVKGNNNIPSYAQDHSWRHATLSTTLWSNFIKISFFTEKAKIGQLKARKMFFWNCHTTRYSTTPHPNNRARRWYTVSKNYGVYFWIGKCTWLTWLFCEKVLTLDEHSEGAVDGGVDDAGVEVTTVESWSSPRRKHLTRCLWPR